MDEMTFFKQLSNEVFHEMRFKYCTYFDYFANATNFTITANIMRRTNFKTIFANNAEQGVGLVYTQFFK